MKDSTGCSVIIVIGERVEPDIVGLHQAYRQALAGLDGEIEFVYVLDGPRPEVSDRLGGLVDQGEPVRIVELSRWFGEAAALDAGLGVARHECILTLPAYHQVDPAGLPRLLEALDSADMVICRRWPRHDSLWNRIQTRLFRMLVRWTTGERLDDLGCGARAFRKSIMKEISLYGEQHRFLPLLARQRGFRVVQVDLPQSRREKRLRVYAPGVYLRRLLDLLTVFFLSRFTRKPLRFFGLIGSGMMALGLLILVYLAGERLFGGVPLADRPALLLGALFLVLGVQSFALGLIGELIIFTHAGSVREYTIDRIITGDDEIECKPGEDTVVALRKHLGSEKSAPS